MTQDIIPCSKCGTNNLRGQRYCGGCNQRLHYNCQSCGEEVDNVLHNCPKCKVALNWPTVGQVDPKLIRPGRPAMAMRPQPGRTLPVRPPTPTIQRSMPTVPSEPAGPSQGRSEAADTAVFSGVQRPRVDKGRALVMIAGLGIIAIGLLVVLVVLAMALLGNLG